jgi:hypothetical protein
LAGSFISLNLDYWGCFSIVDGNKTAEASPRRNQRTPSTTGNDPQDPDADVFFYRHKPHVKKINQKSSGTSSDLKDGISGNYVQPEA